MSFEHSFQVMKLEIFSVSLDLVFVSFIIFTKITISILPSFYSQIVGFYQWKESDNIDVTDDLGVVPAYIEYYIIILIILIINYIDLQLTVEKANS